MQASTKTQHYFFLVLFTISAIIMFYLWRPFLTPLVLAGSLAIVFHPVYVRLTNRFGNRENLAAFATVIIILILVLIPLLFVGGLLFSEARNLYIQVVTNSGGVSVINTLVAKLQTQLQSIAPDINLDLARYAQGGLEWVLAHLNTFFSGFFNVMLGLIIMFIALFFFLRDGRAFRDKVFVLSPLDERYDKTIFSRLILAINSVIKGSIVIGLVQGVFATIGFVILGVPNPILWGVAAMLASFIPGVGTSLITVPAIIFLLVTAPLWKGIALIVWAGAGVGLIDNFLTPYVLNRGMKIHQFFILISVLGGIIVFGPIGVIMGPIMLAFFFALLDIYPIIIKNEQLP